MRRRRGIGLVELVVVLGLMALLAGLLLSAVQSARNAATRADCQNQLHQIGLAILNYENTFGSLPPRSGYDYQKGGPTAMEMLNWMPFILPQIEQGPLWAVTDHACQIEPLPYVSPPHRGFSTPVKAFICPADPRLLTPVPIQTTGTIQLTSDVAMTSHIGSGGVMIYPITPQNRGPTPGAFGYGKSTRLAEVTDGTSQTIMVGERPPPNSYEAGQWYQGWVFDFEYGPDGIMNYLTPPPPGDPCGPGGVSVFGPGQLANPCDRFHYWSLHRGGANFLLCDGSVRFLPYSASPLLPQLITRAAGDVASLP